jgi:hypothetical protein
VVDTSGTTENPSEPEHSAPYPARLRAEVERLRDDALRQMNRADRRVRFWATLDVALCFPAALLAGLAGATGLATTARVPAAVLALLSAGFSAGAGFLRSDVRRIANKRSRRAWGAVDAEARLVLALDLDHNGAEAALRRLFDKRQDALAAYEGKALD